ncbi:hypothetical protein EON64_09915 [archaeon]|nr:MAG: hypothetical protein EON64_09915 [archaeon]
MLCVFREHKKQKYCMKLLYCIAMLCLCSFIAGYILSTTAKTGGRIISSESVRILRYSSRTECDVSLGGSFPANADENPSLLPSSKPFFCYFLAARNLTYNGYTNNLPRRLRQHNRELAGGALSTWRAAGQWEYIAVIHSPSWTQRQAMKVEYRCKYPTGSRRRPRRFCGPLGRILSLPTILERFTENAVYVFVHKRFEEESRLLDFPSNVHLRPLASLVLTPEG